MTAQQLDLAGMPERLFVCTPTRLLTWLDCPRRYRFTYLERPRPPKGPPWAHNSVGASVHTALADLYRLPPEQRSAPAAGRLLERAWLEDGFRDEAQSREWRGRAREMVVRYAATIDLHAEPVGVERTVALRTDRLALSGRVDRIDLREAEGHEQLVVVDYKTGRHVLTTADARSSLALAVYALAAARVLRRPCVRVELHHLPSGDVVSHDHTDDSLERHLGRATSIGREAAGAEQAFRRGLSPEEVEATFPPVVSAQCRWCDFARSCPEAAVGGQPPAPSWAALG